MSLKYFPGDDKSQHWSNDFAHDKQVHELRDNQIPIRPHYNDVIMNAMASQITGVAVVYSTVVSDKDQRKYQSSISLAFVWLIPRTKGQ